MIIGIILIILGLSILGVDKAFLKPLIGISLVIIGIITLYQWYHSKKYHYK